MTRHFWQKQAKNFKKIFKASLFVKIKIFGLILIVIVLGFLTFYSVLFAEKIYPNIIVSGISIGGENFQSATDLLSQKFIPIENIVLIYQDKKFIIKAEDIGITYDLAPSIERAFRFTRTGNLVLDLSNRTSLLFHSKHFGVGININDKKLQKIISAISDQISENPQEPSIGFVDGKIRISKGVAGKTVNQEILTAEIEEHFSFANRESIEIPFSVIDHTLKQTEADALQKRAESFIGKNIQMKFEEHTFNINDSDIIKLINTRGGYNMDIVAEIAEKNSKLIDRKFQNPKFVFEGGRVQEFLPALDGISTNREDYVNKIVSSLDLLFQTNDKSVTFDIPVTKTPPDVTMDSVNNLGIKELVGRGSSTYYHSIPSRVHNVALAASRINGTLVKPGDTFSFNDVLGDVSQFTGYEQAYIISEGKTILGDGGGVCQVSSTLFRAILNAGLPITERQAHAYRVGYYEQGSPPGLDATVYAPSPDLKFKNDTNSYILIEAKADTRHYSLVFELYGTSDGRASTISKPVITNITSPLPTIYRDDPTIPAGTLKQIDYSASGARVTFNYTVTRGQEVIYQKTFISNYRPWAAVYLRGTGN